MSAESENFMGHLLHSHDLVRSWPDWKKNMWPDNDKIESESVTKSLDKKTSSRVLVLHETFKRR